MERLVILSYDASKDFKEAYEKTNQKQFKEEFIWGVIEDSKLGHLYEKPVESTLLIKTDLYPDRYVEIGNLLHAQFPGLYFVIALICQIAEQDKYTENANPTSLAELNKYLKDRARVNIFA